MELPLSKPYNLKKKKKHNEKANKSFNSSLEFYNYKGNQINLLCIYF